MEMCNQKEAQQVINTHNGSACAEDLLVNERPSEDNRPIEKRTDIPGILMSVNGTIEVRSLPETFSPRCHAHSHGSLIL